MPKLPTARPKLADFALLCAAAALGACQQPESPTDDNVIEEPVLNLPSVPTPEPPLDRAGLLAFVAEAASASASGAGVPAGLQELDGRQFELRIRFGCRGPETNLRERWLGWSFDPEQRRIRVRAMPTISMDEALVAEIGGDRFEAVEGFWMPRPWLLQPVCPAAAAVRSPTEPRQEGSQAQQRRGEATERQDQAAGDRAEPDSVEMQRSEPVPRSPRIGIAQFFTEDDARTRRRDMRPYEASHTLAEGKAISSQGYNLVLSGRLKALPGRGVIECSARGPDSPPECLVSAEFLRVLIEQPDTGEVIAEWGGG